MRLSQTLWATLVLVSSAVAAPPATPPATELPRDGLHLVLEGPISSVSSLAFHPDGTSLAAASFDGRIGRIWDLPSGAARDTTPHRSPLTAAVAVAWSPDGKRLAIAAAERGRVSVLDAATGKVLARFDGDETPPRLRALAFSGDGKLLAEAQGDAVRLRDVATGKVVDTLREQAAVQSIAFAPDGKVLAVAAGASLRLYDPAGRQDYATLTNDRFGSPALAFSADGSLLAAPSFQTVRVWDVRRKELRTQFRDLNNMVHAVAFSPDGTHLAASGYNLPVRVWELASGEPVAEFEVLLRDEPRRARGVRLLHDVRALTFSRDGRYLAAGTFEMVRLWDFPQMLKDPAFAVDSGLPGRGLQGPPDGARVVGFSPDGKYFAAGNQMGEVRLYEVGSGRALHTFESKRGGVLQILFTPDSKTLIAPVGNHIYRWSVPDGEVLGVFERTQVSLIGPFAVAADGRKLFGALNGRWLHAWDLATGEQVARHEVRVGQDAQACDLRPEADGKSVAVLYRWGGGCVWVDPATGDIVRRAQTPAGGFAAFRCFTGDGRVVGETGPWPKVNLLTCDPADGRGVEFGDCDDSPTALLGSPDGKLLAGSFPDGALRLWDVAARRERIAWRGHLLEATGLAFSPDGKVLASASGNRLVKLWDVPALLARGDTQAGPAEPRPAVKEPVERPPADEKQLATAAQARDLLKKYCYRCHGQDGAAEGGFNFALDSRRLTGGRLVVAGDPKKSRLLQRVLHEEMPPDDEKPRPEVEEVLLLKRWIEAGAPGWSAPEARKPISLEAVMQTIREDRRKLPEDESRFTWYLTLTPLYNAGVSEDELQTMRQALSKLVNSLSTGEKIVVPHAIDPARTLFRINLRDYGWHLGAFTHVGQAHPFNVVVRLGPDQQEEVAPLRADWFIHAVSRPPLYHALLDIPEKVQTLEERLKVSSADNIRQGKVLRAGFNGSGVSRNNRLIERHEGTHGYYWKSYDFGGNAGRQNLFAHPLGPAPGPNTFQHDGGEIIFRLRNGLQAYMLADARGNRLDRGPTNVVSDPKHPDRVVENGISCMSCHARGLIDKEDQIRAHLEKNPGAFREQEREAALVVYPLREAFAVALKADAAAFQRGVAQTGAVDSRTEPTVVAALRYEADLDLKRAAAELWMTPEDLAQRLDDLRSLAREVGGLRADGGTIHRQLFVRSYGTLVGRLNLGRYDTPRHLEPGRESVAVPAPREVSIRSSTPYAAGGFQEVVYNVRTRHISPAPAIDPTFCVVATLKDSATVQLFDLDGPKLRTTLNKHNHHICAVAFSADGKLFASGSHDGNVRIWDAKTGTLKSQYGEKGTPDPPFALAFSPDGRRLAATGRMRGETVVIDVASGRFIDSVQGNLATVVGIAYTPDNRYFVTADGRGLQPAVVVWDAATRKRKAILPGHDRPIFSVACSPDGRVLATTSSEGAIRLWDTATWDQAGIDRLATRGREATSARGVAFSPDGKLMATAHDDGCLVLWDAENLRDLVVIEAHATRDLQRVAFSPDGRRLATSGADGTVKFWDVVRMKQDADPPR